MARDAEINDENGHHKSSGLAVTILLAGVALVLTEWVSRGSLTSAVLFASDFVYGPVLTIIGLLSLLFIWLDALAGRRHIGFLAVLPIMLLLAAINLGKQLYLPDPFYPNDIFYARQVVELIPVLAAEKPFLATGMVAFVVIVVGLFSGALFYAWRRFPKLSRRTRLIGLGTALPLFLALSVGLESDAIPDMRALLHARSTRWDQKRNYDSNGLLLGLLYNLPEAGMKAPSGYAEANFTDFRSEPAMSGEKKQSPDIIFIMSESFWDPTRLPNVSFAEDPMPFIRSMQSGYILSPEFGGVTANVEFEAVTGFSNAFLPSGSVPYQHYITSPLPSMATFLEAEGYTTKAIHPFKSWFWNRTAVYKALGFQSFRSLKNMQSLEDSGRFASDQSLMEDVIAQAEATDKPFFFHVVTMQGHGTYEPHRYARNTVAFDAGDMPDEDRESLATYVEGVKQSDASMKTLIDWAKQRKRETIIVFFGDHLPPLGHVYVSGGYLKAENVERRVPFDEMKREHETPLIIWSSAHGIERNTGTISPSLLPEKVARLAGLEHPYYTGVLGDVASHYNVIDRYLLEGTDGKVTTDWQESDATDPVIAEYRLMQYDAMFGKKYGVGRFFPDYTRVASRGATQ